MQTLWIETARDISIIFMGVVTATFFTIAIIVMIVLGLLSRSILKKGVGIIDEDVKPLFDSAKQTAETTRGTVTYVSESAVAPIVRTYGVVAGVRRAASVIAGLTGAGNEKPKA
jgi:hypothetical protein